MNTTLLSHILHFFDRRRRGTLMRVLAALLSVTILASGFARSAPANAAGTSPLPPPDLLYQPSLLDSHSIYSATPAQQSSLGNLEQAAIAAVIHDHGLSPSDAVAVQSWGRDDAEGALWGLLVQAIKTTPSARTIDQQNAVDWLTGMIKPQGVAAADGAAREYVKFAGLGTTAFENLLKTNPSENALQTFLSGSVLNYQLDGTGFCNYQAPAPYQSEYDGSKQPGCTGAPPCTLICPFLQTPTYDQFVRWGSVNVRSVAISIANSPGFADAAHSIAIGLGFDGAVLGAGLTGAALSSGLAPVLGSTALASALFPIDAATVAAASEAGIAAGEAVAGALTASGVGIIVAAVILAVVVGVIVGIDVFNAADLPGKLATLIAGANARPDLQALLGSSQGTATLYTLFVGATLPTPQLSCANQFFNCLSLNAPPIPDLANADPEFGIISRSTNSAFFSNSISWKDATLSTTSTARLSGNWFIDHVTASDSSAATVQTLRIHYTDWNGKGHTAWVLGNPTDGYEFLGTADLSQSDSPLDPSTCVAAGKCFYTPGIEYVGTDGNDYTANPRPAEPPKPMPLVSANPVEASPVSFTDVGSSPLGLDVTDQWQFELPQTGLIVIGGSGGYDTPVSGPQASYTWQTSGTFHVQLTETDSLGRSTVETFTVSVADIPPKLALSPAQPPGPNPPPCIGCDVRIVPLGSSSTLTGTVTHAGSSDTEELDINWGDNTPDDFYLTGVVTPFPKITIVGGSATAMQFSAVHTYATTGAHNVTVKVTDQSGASRTASATENVQTVTKVTWPAPAAITYGAPLGATQLDATATVPGTFTYSVDGNPVTPNEVLPAGLHPLAVTFTPTDQMLNTTPSPVSVSLMVNPAPLIITAQDKITPYGHLPSFTWMGAVWVNGESASTLATAPNSAPTCSANVNGVPLSPTTAPGIYSGAISCAGAVDPNYQISYGNGRLTIDPLISLDEQGLPSGVPHQATLDGKTVTLPDTNLELPFGSTHSYTFPPTVTGAAGAVYITNDAGRGGAVTANLSDTAVYQTMSQVVSQALASGGIKKEGLANDLTHWLTEVQKHIAAGDTSRALADLHKFAAHVRARSGKDLTTATAQLLLADAQLVYASLGGTGSV